MRSILPRLVVRAARAEFSFALPRYCMAGSLILAALACAPRAARAEAPAASTAPAQEAPAQQATGLQILRVQHRDAAEVAELLEMILDRTVPADERVGGVVVVDPKTNSILLRGAGAGAQWPVLARGIIAQLDQPEGRATLRLSLWRTGWVFQPGRPAVGDQARQRAETILGGQAGEELDSYRAPVESGAYFSAILNCDPEPPLRVLGICGPVGGGDAAATRLAVVRVEMVEDASAAPVSGPGGAIGGQAPPRPPASESAPAAMPSGKEAAAPGAEKAPEEPASELLLALPPPMGEVVFMGPVSVTPGKPALIGPFSAPWRRGQFLIACEVESGNP